MVLTRQEKEKLIKNLYDQGKTYQEIAREARVSVRDIKPVLEKAEKEREKELGIATEEGNNEGTGNRQTQKKISTSTQAYRLFSEGKTPLEVTIELNISSRKQQSTAGNTGSSVRCILFIRSMKKSGMTLFIFLKYTGK